MAWCCLRALVIAPTFALVFRRMMARGAHLPVAILILLLALAASAIHFSARPHWLPELAAGRDLAGRCWSVSRRKGTGAG